MVFGESRNQGGSPAVVAEPKPAQRLGERLVAEGLVSPSDVETALGLQPQLKSRLGAILVRLGALSEDALYGVLAQQLGLPLLDAHAALGRLKEIQAALDATQDSARLVPVALRAALPWRRRRDRSYLPRPARRGVARAHRDRVRERAPRHVVPQPAARTGARLPRAEAQPHAGRVCHGRRRWPPARTRAGSARHRARQFHLRCGGRRQRVGHSPRAGPVFLRGAFPDRRRAAHARDLSRATASCALLRASS